LSFLPCIPTRGTEVPAGPDWLHEIKHDGYRLIVQREGKRVRLFTCNGYDWSNRYPLITEAALRNRNTSFVIDGEAVLLGVDGRSDFDGLVARSTTRKSNSMPSTVWSATVRTSASCR
jgi:bifunctional non-homologous end joining protein LigD